MSTGESVGWGRGAMFFHWISALLIAVQCGLGLAAVAWRISPLKLELFAWHKSIGVVILGLTAWRLAWRLAHPVPAPLEVVPPWTTVIARLVHRLLYAVIFALPLSGWVISSASRIPFRVFGTLPLPAIVGPSKATADAAALVHQGLGVALVLLLAAHVGAALWHHCVRKDDTLRRMLPWR